MPKTDRVGDSESQSDVPRKVLASFPPPELEQVYLRAWPDVAEAVTRGAFTSGLQHWHLHGREEGRSLGWTKADIINFLGRMGGYRTYLEICSPTSGLRYAEVDRSKYRTCHRLMYRCPPDHDDGMGIDFRSADLDIGDCVERIRAGGVRYDVILVDPFHEYETSVRDLKLAIELIGDGGTIVVHDCDPRCEATACPRFIQMDRIRPRRETGWEVPPVASGGRRPGGWRRRR